MSNAQCYLEMQGSGEMPTGFWLRGLGLAKV